MNDDAGTVAVASGSIATACVGFDSCGQYHWEPWTWTGPRLTRLDTIAVLTVEKYIMKSYHENSSV